MSMGRFNNDIRKSKKTIYTAMEKTIRGSAIELFRAVILDTPVITGRLRDNWQASMQKPATGVLPISSSGVTMMAAASKANEFDLGDKLYFANNVEYALKVERGIPGGQRPQGMLAVNLAKFRAAIEKFAKVNRV
jgi:hypothetical protein